MHVLEKLRRLTGPRHAAIAAGVLSLLLAALLLSLVIAPDGTRDRESGVLTRPAWVAVQPPAPPRELLAQGVIDGQVRVDVTSAFEGVVKSVFVEAGDTVEKDAVLMELGTSTVQSQILEAKAAVLKSEQAYNEARDWKNGATYRAAKRQVMTDQVSEADAQRKLIDTQRLFDQGIVARDELVQSLQALQSAKSQLAGSLESIAQIEERYSSAALELAELEYVAQKSKLTKLESHLKASVIRAPISGVVTLVGPRNSDGPSSGESSAVGGKVGEGAVIARVVDTTKIRVVGSVVEATIGLIKAGQRAKISPISQPGLVLEGRVSRVSALPIDTGTFNLFDEQRTAKFQIVIEASSPKDGAVLPKLGTNAEIAIVLDQEADPGLLVPLAAVQTTKPGHGQVRARRAGQSPRLVEVRLGATTAQGVHVHGLTLEDEVEVVGMQAADDFAADMTDTDTPPDGLRSTLRNLFGGGASADSN